MLKFNILCIYFSPLDPKIEHFVKFILTNFQPIFLDKCVQELPAHMFAVSFVQILYWKTSL